MGIIPPSISTILSFVVVKIELDVLSTVEQEGFANIDILRFQAGGHCNFLTVQACIFGLINRFREDPDE